MLKRKWRLVGFISWILLCVIVAASFAVHVKGYTRKDGTYVAPYERSAPSHSKGYTSKEHTNKSPVAIAEPRDKNGRIKRSEEAKREFMRMTGYPYGRPGYVVDHIIPLKRDGKDDPSNMQWQTIEEAKKKDKWE